MAILPSLPLSSWDLIFLLTLYNNSFFNKTKQKFYYYIKGWVRQSDLCFSNHNLASSIQLVKSYENGNSVKMMIISKTTKINLWHHSAKYMHRKKINDYLTLHTIITKWLSGNVETWKMKNWIWPKILVKEDAFGLAELRLDPPWSAIHNTGPFVYWENKARLRENKSRN